MRYVPNTVSMVNASEGVAILKTTGMTGVQIMIKAPLTFIGVTYIGSVFFGYFGNVAGNTPAGSILNYTIIVFFWPMKGVEVVLNGIILGPVSSIRFVFPRSNFFV